MNAVIIAPLMGEQRGLFVPRMSRIQAAIVIENKSRECITCAEKRQDRGHGPVIHGTEFLETKHRPAVAETVRNAKEQIMKGSFIVGRAFAAVCLVCLVMAIPAGAHKGKPITVPDIPVITTIDDFVVNAAIKSDGKGAYVDGELNVQTRISYQFGLDTNVNEGDWGRRVYLQFPNLGGCNGYPCPSGGLQDIYLATIMTNPDGSDILATMNTGTSWNKRTAINWVEGINSYVLRWNYPVDAKNGNVRFTCLAASGGACTSWTASPTGTAGLYIKVPVKKNSTEEILLATVNMPFVMNMVKK
jgi:hypothetical protein